MKRSFTLSSLLLIVFSTFLLISCKKNMDTVDPIVPPGNEFTIPAATPVDGSLSGLVVNENNIPVNNARVDLGTSSVQTDANGVFNFNNVTLDKYISTVTVSMNGYFKAYRSFSATAGRNVVSIKLIPKQLSGTVTGSASGQVDLANGTKLSFQANSVKLKSTGAAYTGTVNVYASYIDPTAADIGTRVPGSFMGKDANNLYSLQSTGMIAVELETSTGEPLQLITDKPATIQLPIPASLLSKAPATIDTWSLNDQGVWEKEGTATKSGNFYEMQVSHFSFWNCDVPANAIYLTLNVVDQNGNPLANTEVQLTIPGNTTWWATTYGYTNSAGVVSGMVPAGLALQMNIYPDPYTCNLPATSQSIGPFTSNTTLTVTATIAPAQTLTVSGTATDCSNAPLQNGTAIINIDQYTHIYASVVNGSYTATVTLCSPISSLDVTILDSLSSTLANSGTVTVSGSTVTVPNIIVCGATPNAVFTFGTVAGTCQASYGGTFIQGLPLNINNNIVYLMVNVTALGSYQISTPVVDGISFSVTGVFTSFGTQTVSLVGSGTPTATGTFSYPAQAAGITGCPFDITVGNPSGGAAVFTWGAGGACQSTTTGTYTVGVPLDSSTNMLAVVVNVTVPGSYAIVTSQVNGISFTAFGTFTTTGVQTVSLGGTGTPLAAGSFTYLLSNNGGVNGCSVIVNVTPNTNAIFSFAGAPGTCSGATVSGTYTSNTPLGSSNFVVLTVNVTAVGNYSITTNNGNGIIFSASGTFTTTGMQSIDLMGSGTPSPAGLVTFIPQAGGGITGCVFTVQVN